MESIILIVLALVFGYLLVKSKSTQRESSRKRRDMVEKIKQRRR